METKRLLLYLGDGLIGDINKFAKDRQLSESLKSESTSATADQMSFSINWRLFQDFIKRYFDDDPATMLRVGKTRIIFEINGNPRFAGFLAARPARSGIGSDQTLGLTFYEHFARLSGDLVCDPSDKMNPVRSFESVPAQEFAQQLINEFIARAQAAGENLNWSWGRLDQMANKSMSYKDFQTVSKALCDAMNNTSGAGKFDIVYRTDPDDYTHQIIDVVKPRGKSKNIIIQYPSDGVYKLWANDYSVPETNEFASEILVAGNGQVGNPEEMTAKLGVATNSQFVQDYCYWRGYETASNLISQDAVNDEAATILSQRNFALETPQISLIGRPIAWGEADNDDNGLAIGDSFYLDEQNDDGSDHSGYYRIIALDTTYDDNGVATVTPTLMRQE